MEIVFRDKKLQDKFKRFEAGARNLKIDGLLMKTEPLLNKKVGVVLDGRIYPIIKGRTTSYSFLQSANTPNNKEIFKAVIQAVTKAKTKEEKEGAYIRALENAGNISPNVSMFALRVADTIKVDARANNGLNLYKRQNIRKFYPADVTPPPPNTEPPKPAVASKKEMPDMKKEESEKMVKRKMRGEKSLKKETPIENEIVEEMETPSRRNMRGQIPQRATPAIKDDKEELEVFDVDAMGNIREERAEEEEGEILEKPTFAIEDEREEPDAISQIAMGQRIGYNPPPPPNPPNNNNNNIQMEISKNDAERRQIELNKATADEETKAEELEKDNIPDISKHGHQVAIQNVFIKEGKDFTFIKKQVERNKYLNNDNKNIKAEIDLIYAYYSTLFPLTAPKEYSKDNCLELKTLEFQYKRNIQFERKWKSSLANMGGGGGGGASAPNGQTMGAIINLENMGMTAQQLFQRGQPATQPTQPTAPLNNPPVAPQNPAQKDSTGGNPIPKGTSALPLTDIQQKVIPQPQNIKPKSTRKRAKRVKFQDVKLKVRQKQIKTNLLFTNPKISQTPPQPEGDLPMFNFRNKINNRRKL